MWKIYVTVLMGTVLLLMIGLGTAYHYDSDSLRTASIVVPMIVGSATIMLIKRRSQKSARAAAPRPARPSTSDQNS